MRSARSFARPGVTALIVMSLALGLGANATIFTLIDALVVHPFPFPGVDRVCPRSGNVAHHGLR